MLFGCCCGFLVQLLVGMVALFVVWFGLVWLLAGWLVVAVVLCTASYVVCC